MMSIDTFFKTGNISFNTNSIKKQEQPIINGRLNMIDFINFNEQLHQNWIAMKIVKSIKLARRLKLKISIIP